jgi:hypothetical protein
MISARVVGPDGVGKGSEPGRAGRGTSTSATERWTNDVSADASPCDFAEEILAANDSPSTSRIAM